MRRRVATALETGRFRGPLASWLAARWATAAAPARRLSLPGRARVIGVAGATLGGSGATPCVLALATRLAATGASVAVVAHGYRARIASVRRVRSGDAVDGVGDEALWLARALGPLNVPVWVGPDRAAVLERASGSASIVVADNLLQTAPHRLALSVLVVDASEPWGAGRCPPRGDLRAPVDRLIAASDAVVALGRSPGSMAGWAGLGPLRAESTIAGLLTAEGAHLPLAALAAAPFGVVLGVARPARVLESLAAHGLHPAATQLLEDHAPAAAFQRHARISMRSIARWVTSAKCATKLGPTFRGAPLVVLDHRVELPETLVERARGFGATTRQVAW